RYVATRRRHPRRSRRQILQTKRFRHAEETHHPFSAHRGILLRRLAVAERIVRQALRLHARRIQTLARSLWYVARPGHVSYGTAAECERTQSVSQGARSRAERLIDHREQVRLPRPHRK